MYEQVGPRQSVAPFRFLFTTAVLMSLALMALAPLFLSTCTRRTTGRAAGPLREQRNVAARASRNRHTVLQSHWRGPVLWW